MIPRSFAASTSLGLLLVLAVPGQPAFAGGSHAAASDPAACGPMATASPALASPVPSPASLASVCPSPVDASPAPAASGSPAATTITVEARDLFFSPAEITVPGVGATRLMLADAGRVVHNLTVDELAIQLVVSPGGTAETELVDPPLGTYEFYCSVSGHREAGMVGTLTVE